MGCLSESQIFLLQISIKENFPNKENFHKIILNWVDNNAEKECRRQNVQPPPTKEIFEKAYNTKFTRTRVIDKISDKI